MHTAHTTLQDTLRQILKTIYPATLRTPAFSRVRFLFLSNGQRYRRLDDRLNEAMLKGRLAALEQDPRFEFACLARTQVESLRMIFELQSERAIQIGLDQWIRETRQLRRDHSRHEYTQPGWRGFYYGFRDTTELFEKHRSVVVAGLLLQSTEGISLASSRLLIRRLNGHPAKMQSDFEYFRRTALFSLGSRANRDLRVVSAR